jgi:PAS domain S-box-containing protein
MGKKSVSKKGSDALYPYHKDECWNGAAALRPEYLTIVDPELRIHFVNHLQPGLGDPRGRCCLDFISPGFHDVLREAVANVLTTGIPQPYELRGTGPDGETSFYSVWASLVIHPNGERHVALSATDITHLRRIEERLVVSDEMLRSLVRNAPDFICVLDREYRVLFVNQALAHDPEAVIGQTLHSLFPVEVCRDLHQAVERVFDTGEHESRETFMMDHSEVGDEQRLLSTRLGPIYRDSVVQGVTLIATDITTRVRAEEALRASEDKLRQSQKMRALGQLTGGVAHDFNNLLTVIQGSLSLAKSGGGEEHLDHAMKAVSKAKSLTERLLAFGRRQSLQPRTVNLYHLADDFSEVLHRTLGDQVRVQLEGEVDLWSCRVDVTQLENAILNLALNARDAMGADGGVLRIMAGNATLADKVAEELSLEPGDYLRLEFIDEGSGMDEETMRCAFEPFFTTKDVGMGSGLGLSMVYGFARQSGGQVVLQNIADGGFSVSLYFPRCLEEVSAPVATPVHTHSNVRGSGQLILVVEDQPDVADVVTQLLGILQYRTHWEASAGPALKYLEEHPEVQLLFTDVVLPHGINGVQLCRQARALRPDLRLVLSSGYDAGLVEEQGGLEGVELLTKPYRLQALADTMHRALAD